MFNVLIIAQLGTLRESLSALLGTFPEIKVISATNDLDSALGFISDQQPVMCIVDYSDQMNDIGVKVDQMKSIQPEMNIIALVDEVQTKQVAEAQGFDRAVIKGGSIQALNKLISECIRVGFLSQKCT